MGMKEIKRIDRINDKVYEHFQEAKSLVTDDNSVFCVCLQGSQNYDLDLYTDEYVSDVDTKAILLPTLDQFCSNQQPISTTHIRDNNEHIDLKDIRVMFDTFKKQNVNFVEVLFSRFYVTKSMWKDEWEELQSIGERLVHCHPAQTVKTMAGLSMEKLKALCHPYPTIIDKINKYGYDGKQLHHIVRINEFMRNYIGGMSFKECLTHHTQFGLDVLMKAKLNQFELEDAKMLAEQYNKLNQEMKQSFIEKVGEGIVDTEPYKQLDDLKLRILKKWFKYELNK